MPKGRLVVRRSVILLLLSLLRLNPVGDRLCLLVKLVLGNFRRLMFRRRLLVVGWMLERLGMVLIGLRLLLNLTLLVIFRLACVLLNLSPMMEMVVGRVVRLRLMVLVGFLLMIVWLFRLCRVRLWAFPMRLMVSMSIKCRRSEIGSL